MVPLVGRRTGFEWDVSHTPDPDVALVDIDAQAAEHALSEACAFARAVITVSAKEGESERPHITRPVRSWNLLDALNSALRQLGELPPITNGMCAYRLVRWPSTATLRHDPRLIRVCGALNSHPQSLQSITQHIAIDPEELETLLSLLEAAACVSKTELARTPTGGRNGGVAVPKRPKLFDKLRTRLGIG